jgi:hypothetical protein
MEHGAAHGKQPSRTDNGQHIHTMIERFRHCFSKRSVRHRPAGQQALARHGSISPSVYLIRPPAQRLRRARLALWRGGFCHYIPRILLIAGIRSPRVFRLRDADDIARAAVTEPTWPNSSTGRQMVVAL